MSIDTIKQNAEILNEAIIKLNSYILELESLKKNQEISKNKNARKLIEEQIDSLKTRIRDLTNYILKVQVTMQKLIDEELQYNAQQFA